jgi:DNA-directed RNA polymerase specialized sigma subunit
MEIDKMQKSSKNSQYSEVLYQLKNLTAEDRMVLGLYLYEGLTSDEVYKILNSKAQSQDTAKKGRKPAQRSRFSV